MPHTCTLACYPNLRVRVYVKMDCNRGTVAERQENKKIARLKQLDLSADRGRNNEPPFGVVLSAIVFDQNSKTLDTGRPTTHHCSTKTKSYLWNLRNKKIHIFLRKCVFLIAPDFTTRAPTIDSGSERGKEQGTLVNVSFPQLCRFHSVVGRG